MRGLCMVELWVWLHTSPVSLCSATSLGSAISWLPLLVLLLLFASSVLSLLVAAILTFPPLQSRFSKSAYQVTPQREPRRISTALITGSEFRLPQVAHLSSSWLGYDNKVDSACSSLHITAVCFGTVKRADAIATAIGDRWFRDYNIARPSASKSQRVAIATVGLLPERKRFTEPICVEDSISEYQAAIHIAWLAI
ncbi:hypothetical protein EV356DRAFT_261449 [Viridothelium virens]|uniref:Uncharacterized protein n=1 Tax=Viridothelium virens TaxID=1048519 RepID=A0A6A6H2K6_VIRVR|nr:hypothetical protein EV356DRAFT_261449 [Viridothelium virens]